MAIVNNTIILKVANRVDLKSPHHKNIFFFFFCNYGWCLMLTRLIVVIILQYIQILNHTHETNIMLYVNYTSIKNLRKYDTGKSGWKDCI